MPGQYIRWPASGSGGGISGPGSSTIGDVATWANTLGTLLGDTGYLNLTSAAATFTSSQIVAPNGISGAPGIVFAADLTTGIYYSGPTEKWAVQISGADIFYANAGGIVPGVSGTTNIGGNAANAPYFNNIRTKTISVASEPDNVATKQVYITLDNISNLGIGFDDININDAFFSLYDNTYAHYSTDAFDFYVDNNICKFSSGTDQGVSGLNTWHLQLTGGNKTAGNGNGGDVLLVPGTGFGSGHVGMVQVPNTNGSPSITPASHSGLSALQVDPTNSKIWLYNGAAWVGVGNKATTPGTTVVGDVVTFNDTTGTAFADTGYLKLTSGAATCTSSQLIVANGTSGAPGIVFASDHTSGMYYSGSTERWAVQIQSADIFYAATTGLFPGVSGTTDIGGASIYWNRLYNNYVNFAMGVTIGSPKDVWFRAAANANVGLGFDAYNANDMYFSALDNTASHYVTDAFDFYVDNSISKLTSGSDNGIGGRNAYALQLTGGAKTAGNGNGGDVRLVPGVGFGTGHVGTVQLPSINGSPSITPSTTSGLASAYVDPTNSTVWLYNGAAWVGVNGVGSLTGDVTGTTATGSIATTAAATQANIVTLSNSTGVAVHGTNTNNSAASGYVGEYITSGQIATAGPTSAAWADLGSIQLTAGDWDVSYLLTYNGTTGGISQPIMMVGLFSGTNVTDQAIGDNTAYLGQLATSGGTSGVIPSYRVSVASGTQNVYAKYYVIAIGTTDVNGRISARRVR